MTLTERIAYAAKLCVRMRAEYHGLIAAQHPGPPPRFSKDDEEQAAFLQGYQEGIEVLKAEGL